MTSFRTKEELLRAQWAEKYVNVAEGKLYTPEASPFPIHEYFKLGLLGKNIKMLEVNAGHALVEHMVADTLTDMTITVGDEGTDSVEQEILDWFKEIDYEAKLEEAMRYFFGAGHAEQQVHRTVEGEQNGFTVSTLDPSTWYPKAPTFVHQKVTEGRIISVFQDGPDGNQHWYAFVEHHKIGNVEYKLYRIDNPASLDGKDVPVTSLPQFEGVKDAATDLEWLPIIQIDRQKASRHIVGTSVLQPIWGLLQEVSEIQTQIRQERIKHFRSKMYAPANSLNRNEPDKSDDRPATSKNRNGSQASGGTIDLNQEIFPVRGGETPPGYIQWDMSMIEKGSNEIDKILSRAAGIVGCPKSVFNLEEAAGNVKVDTEKRKDRRYVRKILMAQARAAQLVKLSIETWLEWQGKKIEEQISVKFASPFDLTQEEAVALMKDMNPEATMVSQEEAIKQVWKDKTPDERQALMDQIEEERQMNEPPPTSALGKVPNLDLNA